MKTRVSEERYFQILNEELAKHPMGEGLAPFTRTPGGYEWPHDNMDNEVVYIDVSQKVMRDYRTR